MLLKLLAGFTFLSIAFFGGCSKDKNKSAAHNMAAAQDPVSNCGLDNKQILIQKEWQIDELYRNISGENAYYKRSGRNNTGTDYGLMRFRFDKSGTGYYIDERGVKNSIRWSFKDSLQRSLVIKTANDSYNWNMIETKGNYLYSTSPAGADVLLTARYIQIP